MAHAAVQEADQPPGVEEFLNKDLSREEFIQRGQKYFAAVYGWLREHNARLEGRQAIARFTKAHDAAMVAVHDYAAHHWQLEHKSAAPTIALSALGGYGRRELFLQSDIDILVLMEPGGGAEAFVKSLVYLLIDMRLNLGYATRSVRDCEERLGIDLDSTTAMTEMRLLSGSKTLFTGCQAAVKNGVTGKWRKWFLRGLAEEWQKRREKYESTVYLLEPNIKSCPGGLRDVHSIQWALFALCGSADLKLLREKAGFEEDEIRHLRDSIGFIEKVRNQLHVTASSKNDQLMFVYQPLIAEALGYEAHGHRLPEEVFMGDYYRHARRIARESERAWRLLAAAGQKSLIKGLEGLGGALRRRKLEKYLMVQDDKIFIDPATPDCLAEDPRRIMRLFEVAARYGFRASDRTLDLLTRVSRKLGVEFSRAPENHAAFLNILRSRGGVAQTLADMHTCQVLDKLIPEFHHLTCMVRIDHYHHYTVDEHTLKAIEMAERLRAENPRQRTPAGRVASQIKKWDVLLFALLMHDIGKGYGKGHALRGGQIAQRVGDRLEMPIEEIDTVRFLVLSHLKLSNTAQRRDVSDPNVARQLAEEIGSLERLKLLYVHTVCDLMAVSPDVYNDWKARLLAETYARTAELLGEKDAQLEKPEPNLELLRKRVLDVLLREVGAARKKGTAAAAAAKAEREALLEEIEAFLRHAGDRYVQEAGAESMAYHILMRRKVNEKQPLQWMLLPDTGSGLNELVICAIDMPGLFQSICGALAAKGINIWSAQIYSTTDGFALNRFQVTDQENKPLPGDLSLERVRQDLNLVLRDELTIEALIEKHRGRAKRKSRTRLQHPPRVLFDNEASQAYTIIEVRANDRPGLLYSITHALSECQLDIQRAIITTDAYTIDVFYVTDLEYNKIHDPMTQRKIEEQVLAAVNEEM